MMPRFESAAVDTHPHGIRGAAEHLARLLEKPRNTGFQLTAAFARATLIRRPFHLRAEPGELRVGRESGRSAAAEVVLHTDDVVLVRRVGGSVCCQIECGFVRISASTALRTIGCSSVRSTRTCADAGRWPRFPGTAAARRIMAPAFRQPERLPRRVGGRRRAARARPQGTPAKPAYGPASRHCYARHLPSMLVLRNVWALDRRTSCWSTASVSSPRATR
jgi:hypothetical protein